MYLFPRIALLTQTPAGATFAASFGPGTYRAYVCVDFKGDGFDLGKPAEFGTYLGNSPIRGLNDGLQEYTGYRSELGALLGFATVAWYSLGGQISDAEMEETVRKAVEAKEEGGRGGGGS